MMVLIANVRKTAPTQPVRSTPATYKSIDPTDIPPNSA